MKIVGYGITVLVLVGATGCGSGLTKFPCAQVTGQVMCEGKPVAKAQVYFEPKRMDDTSEIGQGGYALTDEEGKFSVSTYGDKDGAVLGTHMVRVGKSESSPPCNCALNLLTVQKEVVVTEKGPNQVEIALKKKSATNKDEASREDD